MLGSFGGEVVRDGHLDFNFRDPQEWPRHTVALPEFSFPPQSYTAAVFGDSLVGPALELATNGPVEVRGLWPTHWHASDSFRMSLLGELLVLPDSYTPGQFLFMEAGRYYNQGFGVESPEGGWTYVVLGDKRGLAGKTAKPEKSEKFNRAYVDGSRTFMAVQERLDLVPESHPTESEGTPGLVTTVGPCTAGRLGGSFADYRSWTDTGEGVWLAGALLGDQTAGPVLLLSHTEPGVTSTPAATFETEVARTVAQGYGVIGTEDFTIGDVRIQTAGIPHQSVVAGPNGLDEVIVFGDRRRALPTHIDQTHAWNQTFLSILAVLGVFSTAT